MSISIESLVNKIETLKKTIEQRGPMQLLDQEIQSLENMRRDQLDHITRAYPKNHSHVQEQLDMVNNTTDKLIYKEKTEAPVKEKQRIDNLRNDITSIQKAVSFELEIQPSEYEKNKLIKNVKYLNKEITKIPGLDVISLDQIQSIQLTSAEQRVASGKKICQILKHQNFNDNKIREILIRSGLYAEDSIDTFRKKATNDPERDLMGVINKIKNYPDLVKKLNQAIPELKL